MAAVRLSRLQRKILRWLAADEQRTRGGGAAQCQGQYQSQSAALGDAGLDRDAPYARGKTESVYLTAAGRQKASSLAGSYE